MSFAQLLLESATGAVSSKVAGIFYDEAAEELHFKIAHRIPKEDVRRVVETERLPPVERPFVAQDVDDLKRRFRQDDYDGYTLDQVIYFIANMPGGGIHWLVGKGDDSNLEPGRKSLTRVHVNEVYDEIMAAKWRQTYRENYDPEHHTMAPRSTRVAADELPQRPVTCGHPECYERSQQQPVSWNRHGCPEEQDEVNPDTSDMIDMEAWEIAERAAVKALYDMTHNQPKYFGGDWRTGQRSPENPVHRANVSAGLTQYYLDRARQATFDAVEEFLPASLRGIFLEHPKYGGDRNTESFTVLTPAERASGRAEQLKAQKARALSKSLGDYARRRGELGAALAELVEKNFEEDEDDKLAAFDIPVYILYTELILPARDIVKHLATHFMKSLKAGFVKRISAEHQDLFDQPITTLMWNTGVDELSLFADKADTLSFHVWKDNGEVIDNIKQRAIGQKDPEWDDPHAYEGRRRGAITEVIFKNAIYQAFTLKPPDGGGKVLPEGFPVIHDINSGPLVIFSVPQSIFS